MEPHEETLAVLQAMVELLLDKPEQCVTRAYVTDTGTTFVITPGDGEIGKLIGKAGRTARSIRTILGAAGRKHKTSYAIDITPRQCKHCSCTENTACPTPAGNCHWMMEFFPDHVCSNPVCVDKEFVLRGAETVLQTAQDWA